MEKNEIFLVNQKEIDTFLFKYCNQRSRNSKKTHSGKIWPMSHSEGVSLQQARGHLGPEQQRLRVECVYVYLVLPHEV